MISLLYCLVSCLFPFSLTVSTSALHFHLHSSTAVNVCELCSPLLFRFGANYLWFTLSAILMDRLVTQAQCLLCFISLESGVMRTIGPILSTM